MPPALESEIRRLTHALRQHRAALVGSWGTVALLGLGLIAAILARLRPLWTKDALLLATAWGLSVGVPLLTLTGYLWPLPYSRRLRLLDRRLALRDRLTTAWELTTGRITAPPAMIRHQMRETLAALRRVDIGRAFPARPPRKALLAGAVALLLFIPALTLPNPQEAILARRAAERAAAQAAAERLERIQQTLAQEPALTPEQREAALAALEEALAALRDPHASPEMQQAALTEAERKLAALRSPEADERRLRLAEAAPLSTDDVVRPLAEALQRGDTQAAADYLRAITTPSDHPMTREEVLALADAFNEIADKLQTSDPTLAAQFREAAQNIYQGDMAQAQDAVRRAAETLDSVSQAEASNRALSQTQAGLQETQSTLATARTGQGTSRTQTGQPNLPPGQAQAGGRNPQSGQGNQSSGLQGHHEDSGSSAPYGDTSPRLEAVGGEITIPRIQEEGNHPATTVGRPGPVRVPYREVYATYAEAAEAALSRQAYPPALRNYVRDYFSSLTPNGR